jgi:hypothetical protein
MSPLIVTLRVPYSENEQRFLLQTVESALRTFRKLNTKSNDDCKEPTSQLALTS